MAGFRSLHAERWHEPLAERALHWRVRRQQRGKERAEHEEGDDRQRHGRWPAPIARAGTQLDIRRGRNGSRPVRHWITRSARARIACGMASPRAFAVFALTTSSNFVGRSTGNSPALAPLKMRSMYSATPAYIDGKF